MSRSCTPYSSTICVHTNIHIPCIPPALYPVSPAAAVTNTFTLSPGMTAGSSLSQISSSAAVGLETRARDIATALNLQPECNPSVMSGSTCHDRIITRPRPPRHSVHETRVTRPS